MIVCNTKEEDSHRNSKQLPVLSQQNFLACVGIFLDRVVPSWLLTVGTFRAAGVVVIFAIQRLLALPTTGVRQSGIV